MKPNDGVYLGETLLPTWLKTLVHQVRDGGGEARPTPFVATPLLQELIAITEGIGKGKEPPFPQDRKSLHVDLQQSLAALGPAVAAAGKAAIAAFRLDLNDLNTLLEQGAGAKKIGAAAAVLIREFSSESGRAAAWKDCVDAFQSGATADECESRLRHLAAVFEAAGFDWPERAKAISDVITLGPSFAYPNFDPTSIPIDARLADAETIVKEPLTATPAADTVVWVVFGDAAMHAPRVTKGPVDLYDSQIWNAVRSGNWPGNPGWTQPAELADPGAKLHLDNIPASEFVAARVSLSGVPLPEARDRGRDLAQAVVQLAGAERQSEWVLFDGAAAYTNGWWGSLWFSDPRTSIVPSSPLMSPVAESIEVVDSALVQRIADDDTEANELVSDLRWYRDATRTNPEQRLVLFVSLIERMLVPAAIQGDKWYGAVQDYFEYLLAFDMIRDEIWDAVYYGVRNAQRIQPTSPEVQKLAAALVTIANTNRIDVDCCEGIRQAAGLRAHVEPDSMQDRMLTRLEQRTTDGPTAARWIEDARNDVVRLLDRARRQRNAVTHGTRTVPSVVASVEPFMMKLVGRLIGAQHHCVEQQLDLTTELGHWRVLRHQRRDDLLNGGPPDALLFF